MSTEPTLSDVRDDLHRLIREQMSRELYPALGHLTGADYAQFFTARCGVPPAHLDAWHVMAAPKRDRGDHIAPEVDPHVADLRLLLAWLQMAADDKHIDTGRITVADMVGWLLVQAAIYQDDADRRQPRDVLAPWLGVRYGWIYEAAGIGPEEHHTRWPDLPGGDAMRLLAGLRGITLPNPLPTEV